ncbi:MAG: secondary thiamine-phosphate synthase enzyme YjbQ, partial [Anaerolineales bacterium]|nr:secondary thiamine-phosphate synthase enzyme YjbQ [Anaerolineales bacterium]
MHTLNLSTTEKHQLIDITDEITTALEQETIKDGICTVYAPHATAVILIMETDGAVDKDVLRSLSNLVPNNDSYAHAHGAPGHGAAHVQAALFGPSESIPLENGHLQLGTWQRVTFCELDGPRSD